MFHEPKKIHRCVPLYHKNKSARLRSCRCVFAWQCLNCGRDWFDHLSAPYSWLELEIDGRTVGGVPCKCLFGSGHLQLPMAKDWEVAFAS